MDLFTEALEQLTTLLAQVRQIGLHEPTAMTLATADRDGRPSARTVLLKGVDADGLVFFTNSESRKGEQLLANPYAAICFHWDALKQQVHLEGPVAPVSTAESDAYWETRPRKSQIGAWASQQSRSLVRRIDLVTQIVKLTAKFLGRPIPRPPYWQGFRLQPERIEFWHARPFRLHERILYQRHGDTWTKELLYP
ncbi:MAG: pyridoxamine 5'-phosphate oxidase [Deltaproteobacteria bacterium]|nr:pyridoxamine 5'-phosphate oxidase [Deltaproteobacteria bacterium]